MYNLVIGKHGGKQTLGYFDRGRLIPSAVIDSFKGSIQTVGFSWLSTKQDNIENVKIATRSLLRINYLLVLRVAFGMISLAAPLIGLLLSEKWLPSAPFVQIVAMYFIFSPLVNTNQQAIKAMGHSSVF